MELRRAGRAFLVLFAASAAFGADGKSSARPEAPARLPERWSAVAAELALGERTDLFGLDLSDPKTLAAFLEAADLNGVRPDAVLAEPRDENRLELLRGGAAVYARGVARLAAADPAWAAPAERAFRLRALLSSDLRERISAVRLEWDKKAQTLSAGGEVSARAPRPESYPRHALKAAAPPAPARRDAVPDLPREAAPPHADGGASFPWLTLALLTLNVAVYCAQGVWLDSADWGFRVDLFSLAVGGGNPWEIARTALTMLTSPFLHSFDLHLWMNMGALLLYGAALELMIGAKRTGLVYAASAFAAVGVGLPLLHWGEAILYTGASPAIAGLMGAFIPMFLARRRTLNDFVYGLAAILLILIPPYFAGNLLGWLTLSAVPIAGSESIFMGFDTHLIGFLAGLALSGLFVLRDLKADPES